MRHLLWTAVFATACFAAAFATLSGPKQAGASQPAAQILTPSYDKNGLPDMKFDDYTFVFMHPTQ